MRGQWLLDIDVGSALSFTGVNDLLHAVVIIVEVRLAKYWQLLKALWQADDSPQSVTRVKPAAVTVTDQARNQVASTSLAKQLLTGVPKLANLVIPEILLYNVDEENKEENNLFYAAEEEGFSERTVLRGQYWYGHLREEAQRNLLKQLAIITVTLAGARFRAIGALSGGENMMELGIPLERATVNFGRVSPCFRDISLAQTCITALCRLLSCFSEPFHRPKSLQHRYLRDYQVLRPLPRRKGASLSALPHPRSSTHRHQTSHSSSQPRQGQVPPPQSFHRQDLR